MAYFSCSAPSTLNSSNLCFEGGTCAPDGLSCICPPDGFFGHDHSSFHDNNCVFPLTIGFLVRLIVCSVITIPGMIAFATRLCSVKPKGRPQAVGYLTLLDLFSIWMMALGCYVQSGWYEVASVAHLLQLWSFSILAYNLVCVYLLPAVAVFPTRIIKRVHLGVFIFVAFICVIQSVPITIMIFTAQDENVYLYNLAATAFLLNLPILLLIGAVLIYFPALHLSKVVSHMPDSS